MELGTLLGETLLGCSEIGGNLQESGEGGSQAWRDIEIKGLTADSRRVEPGYLFAALAGTEADGAAYIPDACKRGAAAILARPGIDAPKKANVPIIHNDNPRHAFAKLAARFYDNQPEFMVGVTGTNGKSSVVSFVRQIWEQAGIYGASLGTIGVDLGDEHLPLAHTTPDPAELHKLLYELADRGVTHAALETSSHGLAQYRVDGVRFVAAGFTNISRDHLDYHASFEDYLKQKMRLFKEVLPDVGTVVVHGTDGAAKQVMKTAKSRGLKIISVGRTGKNIRLVKTLRQGFSQRLRVEFHDKQLDVILPLVGDFQAENALVAAGLAIACGMETEMALSALENLKGAVGRLELVAMGRENAPIFVDYAHTPDALATTINAIRPYANKRVIVVFGAGGDRDKGKRPQMGAAANELADIAIVTDDNPRNEDPAAIRAAIMDAAPNAIEIGDRRTAIAAGIRMLHEGDVLLIAGKGHESGQTIGRKVVPYSDHEAVAHALSHEEQRG